MAGQWELSESRGSRSVLREPEGETPSGHSPSLVFWARGVQPPTAIGGEMLSTARIQFVLAPCLSIFPGTVIVITSVLSINLCGDGLRDALNPRQLP